MFGGLKVTATSNKYTSLLSSFQLRNMRGSVALEPWQDQQYFHKAVILIIKSDAGTKLENIWSSWICCSLQDTNWYQDLSSEPHLPLVHHNPKVVMWALGCPSPADSECMKALLLWTWAVCQPIWRLVKWIKMVKSDRNYGKSPFSMGKSTISTGPFSIAMLGGGKKQLTFLLWISIGSRAIFFYPAEKGTCARSKNIHVFRGGATLSFGFDSLLIVLRTKKKLNIILTYIYHIISHSNSTTVQSALKGAILHRYDEVILNRPTSWGIKEHGCSPAGLDWLFNVDVILQRISRTWF